MNAAVTEPARPAPLPRLPEPPLIGSAIAFQRDPLGLYQRVGRACGDIGCFHVGPLRLVYVNSPALIEALYLDHADDLEKGPIIRAVFRPMLGESLFNVDGADHARQRKLLAPRFSRAQMAAFTRPMVLAARRYGEGWRRDGARLDLLAGLGEIGREAIASSLLSESGALLPEQPLGRAFRAGLAWIDFALTHPLYPPSGVPTLRTTWLARR